MEIFFTSVFTVSKCHKTSSWNFKTEITFYKLTRGRLDQTLNHPAVKWIHGSLLSLYCCLCQGDMLCSARNWNAVIFHQPASSKGKSHIKNNKAYTETACRLNDWLWQSQTERINVTNIWGTNIVENSLSMRIAFKRVLCIQYKEQPKRVRFSTCQSYWMIHWGHRSFTHRIALRLCAYRHFQRAEQN